MTRAERLHLQFHNFLVIMLFQSVFSSFYGCRTTEIYATSQKYGREKCIVHAVSRLPATQSDQLR